MVTNPAIWLVLSAVYLPLYIVKMNFSCLRSLQCLSSEISFYDKITFCSVSAKGCKTIPCKSDGPDETFWILTKHRSLAPSILQSSLVRIACPDSTCSSTPNSWEFGLTEALFKLLVITILTTQWGGSMSREVESGGDWPVTVAHKEHKT